MKIVVYGRPEPQGSTRAFIPKGWSRPIITTDNTKLKPWRQQISATALCEMGELLATDEAVCVSLWFFFLRPKSLKKSVTHKTTKPDIDKLERAILDALTGVVFIDDSQVVEVHKFKRFDPVERVEIEVEFAEALGSQKSTASAMETEQLCLPTP